MTETAQLARSETTVEGFAEKCSATTPGERVFDGRDWGPVGAVRGACRGQPHSSAELADRTGLQERYLREWLAGMAAAGYLSYDPPSGRYAMPDAHVPVLAEEAGVWFFGAAFFDFSTNTAKPSTSC